MTISVIRRFTDADAQALNAAAVRFATRHGILLGCAMRELDPWIELDDELTYEAKLGYPRLFRLWQRVLCRALDVPTDIRTTVAHGHVGIRVAA